MENKLQLTDERLSKLHLIQEQLQASPNGKLYIWGAAKTAYTVTSFITKNSSLSAAAYVVDDLYFKEGTFLDKPIIKASDFLQQVTENDWIVFGFSTFKRAKELMKEMPSFVKSVYFAFPYHFRNGTGDDGTWMNLAFYEQHKERFEETRNILSDDASKQTLDAFIKACVIGSIEALEELDELYTEGQYFNDLTNCCKPGCFVDCGAYTGDTIESAIDFLGDRIERIIAFEPDPDNVEKLKEQVKKFKIPAENLKLLQKGSYDKAAILRFSASLDISSAISEDGDITIETDSIDNAASDMGQISFIKMDIEGSELKSLLGAADTIRKYHPILAICAYHKTGDLFELPEAIRKITKDSGYRYYLKYHGGDCPDLTELVLYAIPVN